jgi:hypothetical protein
MRADTRQAGQGHDGGRGRAKRARRGRGAVARHDEAVIEAEVRRLANTMRPYGVLRRDALERAAGAAGWHQGGFDAALRAAVRTGAFKQLPAGFYRDADRATSAC